MDGVMVDAFFYLLLSLVFLLPSSLSCVSPHAIPPYAATFCDPLVSGDFIAVLSLVGRCLCAVLLLSLA